jgi:DNA-binding response OmpR family regulator
MKPKILIYEDDESILEVLQMILEEEGYDIVADTHCDNMDGIRTHMPDLILIDLWIPELGGEEVCKEVKSDPKLKLIPVMFISASNDTEKIAKKVNADAFIHKPFDISEVKEKAKKLLSKESL